MTHGALDLESLSTRLCICYSSPIAAIRETEQDFQNLLYSILHIYQRITLTFNEYLRGGCSLNYMHFAIKLKIWNMGNMK